ncbi:MAG: glycosyltransferase family 2 protein [Patescibacteria group bacterium]|nr:glycosyltransferase family 2 protein [Patescibacteria group bacterium]
MDNVYKRDWTYPDPKTTDPKERRSQRIFEVIPGLLTWATLIGMFLFSWLLPLWVAIFIILFDMYWLYRTIYIASYSIMAYRKMRRWKQIDWRYRLRKIFQGDALLSELRQEIKDLEQERKNKNISRKLRRRLKQRMIERKNFLKSALHDLRHRDAFLDWGKVYHVILFPTANEDAKIIAPAIEKVKQSNYPNNRIIILLAMEEREPEEDREKKKKILLKRFKNTFFDFLVTVHKVKDNEMKCKASNTSYAAKKLKKYLEEKNIPLEHVILSNFDCDTQIHPQYLAALTYAYVTEPNRLRRAYQPLPMYHNNLWDTIAPVRVIVTGSSFWHMVESMRPDHMVTFSSHSEPFKTIVEVGYWPVNVISEDSVIFWKAYNYFDGDYQVKPIYLPVSLDAVLGNNYWHTIKNQYKQKHRWAYGIENFPLLARAFWKNKKIGLGARLKYLLIMLEGHHSWATAPFILALLGWLPLIFGGERFNESVLAHNLPYITRYLMTISMIGLVAAMFMGFLLMPPRPKKYSKKRYSYMFFQWFLAPFIAPFLGASPAVHAQTRIILKKYMGEFWVTEKIRRQ